MRTTIDFPDDLLRKAKILAVQRGVTLRDLIVGGLRLELARQELAMAAMPVIPAVPAIHLPADAPVLRMSPVDISEAAHAQEASDDSARLG